jgi:hypothetical protein
MCSLCASFRALSVGLRNCLKGADNRLCFFCANTSYVCLQAAVSCYATPVLPFTSCFLSHSVFSFLCFYHCRRIFFLLCSITFVSYFPLQLFVSQIPGHFVIFFLSVTQYSGRIVINFALYGGFCGGGGGSGDLNY